MAQAEIGLIGLGVMGSNLALNIAEKGHAIAVYNRTTSKTGAFFESFPARGSRALSGRSGRRGRSS
jgi:6-phosphogluconate dehydrogenase